jgi:hypothetical protein
MHLLPDKYFETNHTHASPAFDTILPDEARTGWARYYRLIRKRKLEEDKTNPGTGIQQIATKKPHSRCALCGIRYTCPRAFEDSTKHQWHPKWSRCIYDLDNLPSVKHEMVRNYAAFVSSNPEDLLMKLEKVCFKIEQEIEKEPSYTKTVGLAYLLMNVYKMKFGEKMFVARVTKNLDSPTMDIKAMMEDIRRAGMNKTVDATYSTHQMQDESNQVQTDLVMEGNGTVGDYDIEDGESAPYDAPASSDVRAAVIEEELEQPEEAEQKGE